MPLTVRLRRFALSGALCAVQGPRRMPGQAARKATTKAKKAKAMVAQQVAVAVAWCCKNGKGSKAALANKKKFPLLTQGILDYAL